MRRRAEPRCAVALPKLARPVFIVVRRTGLCVVVSFVQENVPLSQTNLTAGEPCRPAFLWGNPSSTLCTLLFLEAI
jgi:hypothetical protein